MYVGSVPSGGTGTVPLDPPVPRTMVPLPVPVGTVAPVATGRVVNAVVGADGGFKGFFGTKRPPRRFGPFGRWLT